MGQSKADLAWHGSTLLYRTSALLRRATSGPVLVVAAPQQRLPALPDEVHVVRDPVEGLGPMQGVAAGLAGLLDTADAAFVCSTDLPLLHPAFVARVLRGLSEPEVDLVLPVVHGHRQPLAAGYRVTLAAPISELLGAGELRPGMLYRHCAVLRLEEADLLTDPALAHGDPQLDSVRGVNTPEEYAAALAMPQPEIRVDGSSVRAVTLAALTAAVRAPATAAVELNGEPVASDPLLPLYHGDRVRFTGPST